MEATSTSFYQRITRLVRRSFDVTAVALTRVNDGTLRHVSVGRPVVPGEVVAASSN